MDWITYHEGVKDQTLFRKEAFEFAARLEKFMQLSRQWHVLDFGCGFGHVADALAPKVREVHIWDESENMRIQASRNVSHHRNVVLCEAMNSSEFLSDRQFDLILVNSVVQYMSIHDFSCWLGKWGSLLTTEGTIIISDIIPLRSSPFLDLASLVTFSVRHRILFQAIREGFKMWRNWGKINKAQPLQHYSREGIRRNVEAAGLRAVFIKRNLTYRRGRLSVALSRA